MKKFLLLAVIVLFIVVLFLTVTHVMQKSHVEESVNTLAATESRWELQPINLGTISIDKNLTGRVRIEGVVKIGSEVNGRLKSLTVEEGSKVLKGELLAEIDDEKLQATFKLRKASLSSKKALLASVTLRKEEALRNFQRAKKIQPSGIISIAEFERLEFVHRKYRELETAINRVKQCTVYHADDFPEYTTIYKSKDIEDAMEIDDE